MQPFNVNRACNQSTDNNTKTPLINIHVGVLQEALIIFLFDKERSRAHEFLCCARKIIIPCEMPIFGPSGLNCFHGGNLRIFAKIDARLFL